MMKINPISNKHASAIRSDHMSRLLLNYTSDKDSINILEAGCGHKWLLEFNEKMNITGVDLSQDAIKNRMKKYNDLKEYIIADLQEIKFNENQFDIIYCSNVLEHIKNASEVVNSFITWLKPDGLLMLNFPDRNSLPAIIARLTPHWFHLFFYKIIKKNKLAGKPGYGPFPTYFDSIVSKKAIHEYIKSRDIELIYENSFKNQTFPTHSRIINSFYEAIKKIVCFLSRQYIELHDSYSCVLQKK